jgi:hypothetical protein
MTENTTEAGAPAAVTEEQANSEQAQVAIEQDSAAAPTVAQESSANADGVTAALDKELEKLLAEESDPISAAVEALVNVLGFKIWDLKGIDIRPHGIVRVFGRDNSARSIRFTPASRPVEDGAS